MSIMRITGGKRLSGEIRVQGAKNAALPILAATLLADGETVIHNCPRLTDVEAAMEILRHLGCRAYWEGGAVVVDPSAVTRCDIPDALMRRMRSSVIFLGAILARCGEAVLSMPGGCELGPRPIDLHISAMRTLGAAIREDGGNLICTGGALKGCRIDLEIPSVGATENSMIAACGAEGVTVITNAAREPEIVDLADFLNKLGARVLGAGSSLITVEGGRVPLSGGEHAVIPDRIAAATYLSACASAGGEITVHKTAPDDLASVLTVLRETGCAVTVRGGAVTLAAPEVLKPPRPVVTRPYPGFPTDAQPPILAAVLKADGTTAFVETIFENRYRHVGELRRMGADIRIDGRVAVVSGVKRLHGAPVEASDLRGGAALAVAALGAEGSTEIAGLSHIERGYEDLAAALRTLGADAVRIE